MKLTTTTTIKTLLLATAVLYTGAASAQNVDSDVSTVAFVNTFTSGTVYFTLEEKTGQCDGYFFQPPGSLVGAAVVAEIQEVQISASAAAAERATSGYDINVSSLLAAFHSGTNVSARGDESDLWEFSNSRVCRMSLLSVRK